MSATQRMDYLRLLQHYLSIIVLRQPPWNYGGFLPKWVAKCYCAMDYKKPLLFFFPRHVYC
jgi:hypothetical protein